MPLILKAAERRPSKSQQFVESFGSGFLNAQGRRQEAEAKEKLLSSEYSNALSLQKQKTADKFLFEKEKEERRLKNYEFLLRNKKRIESEEEPESGYDEEQANDFLELLPQIEAMSGRDLTPQDLDEIWGEMSKQKKSKTQVSEGEEDYFDKAEQAYALGEDNLGKLFTEKGKISSKERISKEASGEKELREIQSRLHTNEIKDMQFERMEELNKNSKETFPSSFGTALFSDKDGSISPVIQANFSPEAQEFIKLIANQLNGVKDTLGAQISGFEVRKYLEQFPSLINSPEGRERILKQIRLMNQINRDRDEGILDIVDKNGGPGKISLSKAEGIYRKQSAGKMKKIRELIVGGSGSKEFSELPDPKYTEGEEFEDTETGQRYISNGLRWFPVNGSEEE